MPTFTKTRGDRTDVVVIAADWGSGVQTITRPGKPDKVVKMTAKQIDRYRTEDEPLAVAVMRLERILARLPGAAAAIAAEGGLPNRRASRRDQGTAARQARTQRSPAEPRDLPRGRP